MIFQRKFMSPAGPMFLVADDKAVRGLHWSPQSVAMEYGALKKRRLLDEAQAQLEEYFKGMRTSFELPLEIEGTTFQKRVWNALRDIPYGETISYKELANAIKEPNACRAVGGANGKNPLSIIVPCHRVIASGGSLGGYAGGLRAKRALLRLEGISAA